MIDSNQALEALISGNKKFVTAMANGGDVNVATIAKIEAILG